MFTYSGWLPGTRFQGVIAADTIVIYKRLVVRHMDIQERDIDHVQADKFILVHPRHLTCPSTTCKIFA